jgi:hypothetical protein
MIPEYPYFADVEIKKYELEELHRSNKQNKFLIVVWGAGAVFGLLLGLL